MGAKVLPTASLPVPNRLDQLMTVGALLGRGRFDQRVRVACAPMPREQAGTSMNRKDHCWNNTPMESVFHTLKTELVQHAAMRPARRPSGACLPTLKDTSSRKNHVAIPIYEEPPVIR
jgi:hypothetical protein